MRCLSLTAIALLLLAALPGRAEERPTLAEVRALQELVQQAIERAEPSIACILVSRSDLYARRWHQGPPDAERGKLGGFDTRFLEPPFPDRTPGADKRRRVLHDHDLSRPDTVPESYGSGVVLDADAGLVLTNAHVVRGATKIYVRLTGKRGSWADIHAADPRSDLAVLRLLEPPLDLKALPLGDGGKVRKGQFVLSLAHPFAAGFRDGSPSASWGIVSNLARRLPGDLSELGRARVTLHHYGTLIQTDVRLHVGCSGGALLNLKGELIGLTTAQAALTGSEAPAGYAIPIDAELKKIIARLCEGKEVEYGFLGVRLFDRGRPDREKTGVQLDNIVPGSPADRARLRPGERILSINKVPVEESEDLFLQIGKHLVGAEVEVEVASDLPGAPPRRTVTVKLAKLYVPGEVIASQRPPAPAGLRVDPSSILSQKLLTWPRGRPRAPPPGVAIRSVTPGSAADKARLKEDLVITHVDGARVHTPAEFYKKMGRAVRQVRLTVCDYRGRDAEEVRLTLN
jgi:serine protease Do